MQDVDFVLRRLDMVAALVVDVDVDLDG